MKALGFFRIGFFVFAFTFSTFAGPLQRVPNTSLALPSQPPQFGYAINNAFPTVAFSGPVCITSPPGETNRLFILDRAGTIVVITNLASPTRTAFMNAVRVGLARLVMTTIVPARSRMNRRLVSPGGEVMHTGPLNATVGNALLIA